MILIIYESEQKFSPPLQTQLSIWQEKTKNISVWDFYFPLVRD